MSLTQTYIAAAGAALSLIPAGALAATANGTALDVRGYHDTGVALLNSGAGTGTTPTLDVKLQTSPNGTSGWVDIPSATFARVTTAAAVAALPVDLSASLGFLRAVSTIGGTTPSFPVALTLLALKRN